MISLDKSYAAALVLLIILSGCRSTESAIEPKITERAVPDSPAESPVPSHTAIASTAHPVDLVSHSKAVATGEDDELNSPSTTPEAAVTASDAEPLHQLSLSHAVQDAISNTQVFRTAGSYLSPANPLLLSPETIATVYDQNIAKTGVLYGQRSVSASKSDFDPRFGTNAYWNRDEQVQNNQFLSGGLLPGSTLVSETADVSMRLDKRITSGGSVGLVQDWNYDANNVTSRLFQSVYQGQSRAEFRQPLVAGAGKQYTQVAGPVSSSLDGVTGVQQGLLIAAINERMSEIDAQIALNSLLREVEFQYWQFRAAWENEEQVSNMLREIEEIQEIFRERAAAGGPGGSQSNLARIEDQVLTAQVEQKNAATHRQDQEANLKRLLGWELGSSASILPVSMPAFAPISMNHDACVVDAFLFRPELKRTQSQIQSLHMQRLAARSLRKPRLDFVANYHVNGFGDHLLADGTADGKTLDGYNDATRSLIRGDQTGWQMGFEMLYPLGSRLARTQQANLEHQLARANAILREQEREIGHEIAAGIRELEKVSFAVEVNRQRVERSEARLQATTAEYSVSGNEDDLMEVVQSQQALSAAKQSLSQSLSAFMVAETDLLHRTGKLSEQHAIRIQNASSHLVTSTKETE